MIVRSWGCPRAGEAMRAVVTRPTVVSVRNRCHVSDHTQQAREVGPAGTPRALRARQHPQHVHGPDVAGGGYGRQVRTFTTPLPVDLLRSLRPLVAASNDPTIRLRRDRLLRASATPQGPGTLDLQRLEPDRFQARAYGPGRDWLLEQAPALIGANDDLTGFVATSHPAVRRAAHHRPDLRLIRSGCLDDVLVATILAQRVTSREAARSWTRMVRAWGRPAPGPHPLRLSPSAADLATRRYWEFHHLGVERARAERIITVARHLARRAADGHGTPAGPSTLDALRRVPGVGVWTLALVARTTSGDADAVEVGDFHVKHHVSFALAGEPRGTDERMLALLAPFAPHRGRVVRLLLSATPRPPTFGARQRVIPVESL